MLNSYILVSHHTHRMMDYGLLTTLLIFLPYIQKEALAFLLSFYPWTCNLAPNCSIHLAHPNAHM